MVRKAQKGHLAVLGEHVALKSKGEKKVHIVWPPRTGISALGAVIQLQNTHTTVLFGKPLSRLIVQKKCRSLVLCNRSKEKAISVTLHSLVLGCVIKMACIH